MCRPDRSRPPRWRYRTFTAGLVAAFLLATHLLFPDPARRAVPQYLFVITLGYGHLIGAVSFSSRRMARWVPEGVPVALFASFLGTSLLTLFALYCWLGALYPAFYMPLLGLSVWHTIENDLALARSYREGLALGPLPRGDPHLVAIALTALVVALADATLSSADYGGTLAGTVYEDLRGWGPRALAAAAGAALLVRRRRRSRRLLALAVVGAAALLPADLTGVGWLGFGDVFAAATLYHLIGWLVFVVDRGRMRKTRSERRTLWSRIAWVHLPPALLCVALLTVRDERLDAMRYAVFSPAIYLFWSVVHVAQTALVRGLERKDVDAPSRAAATA